MPTTDFCPNCGTHLETDATACPNCGTAVHGALSGPAPTGVAAIVHSIKTKPFIWGGSVLAVAAAAFVVFGGMMGPSGKIVCTATLKQARDFGVISPTATLDSNDAASTDVGNRKSCVARVGNDTYTMVADIKKVDSAHKACRDYTKQAGCIALYSVARSDGVTTYQVRPIDPNDTDEALAKRGLLGLPPAGTGANRGNETAAEGGSGLETETAVDNSAGMQSAPAPQAAPQQ